jgi:TfoX/Sxy family transcriptional regulator of competence genes
MAYDTRLAERIRAIVAGREGVTEKQMFGGIAFLLDGKMFIGLAKNQLMVRVGPDRHDEALARPHVRPMDFTGRPLRGYVYVAPAGYATARALSAWIDWGAAFVATVKKQSRKRPRPRAPRKRSRVA